MNLPKSALRDGLAPDEHAETLGRLTMLTAMGAVTLRVMVIGGALSLLWWRDAAQRQGLSVAVVVFALANAMSLVAIWRELRRGRTASFAMLLMDTGMMAGFALTVDRLGGANAATHLIPIFVVCGVLAVWTACRGPIAGAAVMILGLIALWLAGWLTAAETPWWLNVLAALGSYIGATIVVRALNYVLTFSDSATGELERRHARRVMHDTAIQTLEAIALTATARRDDPAMRTIAMMALSEVARLRGTVLEQASHEGLDLGMSLGETVDIARGRGLNVVLSVRDQGLDKMQGPAPEACIAAVGEALSNVLRHSGTDVAAVELSATADRVQVTVTDGGIGFDPTAVAAGFGVRESIRARLAAVGGGAQLTSSPGRGTQVLLWIPRASARSVAVPGARAIEVPRQRRQPGEMAPQS